MHCANMAVPPSLAFAKAKKISESMNISEDSFKASWQWLKWFRFQRGLEKFMLCGEGTEVDWNDPKFLEELDALCEVIAQYDVENVFNMDETGLFFWILPRYTLLIPDEDLSTTRGCKKSKERVSLVVCSNAMGTHKIPCTMIGKPKEPS